MLSDNMGLLSLNFHDFVINQGPAVQAPHLKKPKGKNMTMNIRKIALTGVVALGAIVGANAPAFSMTASEFYAYVKNCHGRGGTTGIHEDGTLGCHIGMAAVDLDGGKAALVPSKAQIKKLSIKRIPAGVSHSGKALRPLKIKK